MAFYHIFRSDGTCVLVYAFATALLLFLCAIPRSFSDFAPLSYIDFISLLVAIVLTMVFIALGSSDTAPAVGWQWGIPAETTSVQGMLATANIAFAYAFAVTQFTLMAEMHTPEDYVKSIAVLGSVEIVIYTLTGSVIYYLKGASIVEGPALLSVPEKWLPVVWGVALPVIYISGSINTIVEGRYLLDTYAKKDSQIQRVKGWKGWTVWVAIIAGTLSLIDIIEHKRCYFNNANGRL